MVGKSLLLIAAAVAFPDRLRADLVDGVPVTNGLVLWLDANDATTITQSGGFVTKWANKSSLGSVNDATGNSSVSDNGLVLVPSRFGMNKPVVRFDGEGSGTGTRHEWINAGTNASLAITGEMTLMFLLQADTSSGHTNYFLDRHAGGASGYYGQINTNANDSFFRFGNNIVSTAAGTITGQPQILSILGSANSRAIYIDGVQKGLVPGANMWDTSTEPFIFGDTSGKEGGLDADIAELLVFNRALSDLERAAVEAYLHDKWLVVPEPASLALMGTSGLILAAWRLRRRRPSAKGRGGSIARESRCSC